MLTKVAVLWVVVGVRLLQWLSMTRVPGPGRLATG